MGLSISRLHSCQRGSSGTGNEEGTTTRAHPNSNVGGGHRTLFVLVTFSIHAQELPVFRASTDVVIVPVTVTDRSGRFVAGLTADQFEISDAGARRAITQFSVERVPISLGILLDISGSMASDPKARAVGDARWADTCRALELLVTRLDCDTFADAARYGRLWVALAGDVPVGFALVKMLGDDLPHLDEVDVEPAHGRRGLGTALVQAVCEWATASGFSMLTLTTFRGVPWNLPFYARLGIVEVPRDLLCPELAVVVSEEAARGLAPENTRCHGLSMRVVRDLTTISGARAIAGPGARQQLPSRC